MNDIVFLSVNPNIPANQYWDQTLLKDLLQDCVWHNKIGKLKKAIVIIPGARMGRHITKINKELAKLEECKVIITSDEENKFPVDKLKHPNMKLYANYYNKKYKADINWLPIGYSEGTQKPKERPLKILDWFYAGQVNHPSRTRLSKVLKKLPDGKFIPTAGFAQGLRKDLYLNYMAQAYAVPSPGGHVSPDSFRFYEALEMGAMPIPDCPPFWRKLFPDMPLPSVRSWKDLHKEIDHAKDLSYRNKCIAWWQRKKLDIKDELMGYAHPITAIIPVSPIKSHPGTEIIDETIATIKKHLPEVRIIVTFDGVREEQEDKRADYNEFISAFLWKYDKANIYPVIFDEHTHQVGMAREALKMVRSPLILYIEQDTPLTPDRLINWDFCTPALLSGAVDLIRFHFESFIPKEHQHMMIDKPAKVDGKTLFNYTLIRTCQWSQRPHIATKAFYDRILRENFSDNAKSFIEDKLHGVCHNDYLQYGLQGWYNYRLAIYHPDGDIKRSYHTDGRAGEAKYDDSQVF